MADYWKSTDRDPILWCPNEVAADQMGVSVRTIARARGELVRHGWLVMIAMPAGETAARYKPRIPEGCQNGNPRADILTRRAAKSATDSTRKPQHPPQGSDEQDSESPPHTQKPAHDTSDYRLLARHMSNYKPEAVELVYQMMREGFTGADGRDMTPVDNPGRFALRKHAKPCGDDPWGTQSEWQGFFCRVFSGPNGGRLPSPVVNQGAG
jgi:hypothetical protein